MKIWGSRRQIQICKVGGREPQLRQNLRARGIQGDGAPTAGRKKGGNKPMVDNARLGLNGKYFLQCRAALKYQKV